MAKERSAATSRAVVPPYYRDRSWSKLAPLYDPLVRLLFLPFGGERRCRKKFLDFADPDEGEQVLDVCCGTGTLTFLIADKVGSGGTVIGVDLSIEMIRIARKKVQRLSRVTFQKANSESLPFPENRFDRSFISFGLHEMPQAARRNTLKEIHRTLKQGGSLFVLDYNLPEHPFPRLAIKAFVRLLEDDPAYRMLLNGSLAAEVEEAGLVVERRDLIRRGMVQMVQATKSPTGDDHG